MSEPFESPFWDAITEDTSVLEEFKTGSERVVGVIGGAFLEAALDQALKASLVTDEKSFAALFGLQGPAGSFVAKARAGYLMGLYSERVFDDMDRIAKIRNAFAHQRELRNFKTQRIYDLSLALTTPEQMTREHNSEVGGGVSFMMTTHEGDRIHRIAMAVRDRASKLKNARWRFEVTVQLLCMILREYRYERPAAPRF